MTQNKVYDILIVGGGPGGTATAFRARELGMDVLVIDLDDLMKRIRDYSKDKQILPGFGGGDKMRFPKAGPMIDSLRFTPIDKDELVKTYKDLYIQNEISFRTNTELTGLKRQKDGSFVASCWNHAERVDSSIRARNVVLALGCGVPRRFDVPGDTEGIAYRLDDPAHFVGRPVCVVGGGTSAAEAVIALSCAKRDSDDDTPVYWSYRGDRLPRVSKALAQSFFDAYVGHGNVRYLPLSEPAAVVTAEDHQSYLSIRTDRRCIAGRPNETLHLEFPKPDVIACIGEDMPETFMAELGISMKTGGPKNRKRVVVNRYLESEQAGIFLVGDLLSQAYFETDDFQADAAGFREVRHRGNIKSALRDGVLVAQVIKQRLKGDGPVDVVVADAEDLAAPAASEGQASRVSKVGAASVVKQPGPTDTAKLVSGKNKVESDAFLIRVLPGGGLEHEYAIKAEGATTIGRRGCDISFSDDTLLSNHHATIQAKPKGYFLRDEESWTGVFFRLPEAVGTIVKAGSLLRMGRQFLLFSELNGKFFFTVYDHHGKERGRYNLLEKAQVAGREAAITLDSGDTSLSRRHLAMAVRKGRVVVKDLKSANGTFLRLVEESRLKHGDRILLGGKLFLFCTERDAILDTGRQPVISAKTSQPLPVVKPLPKTAVKQAGIPVAAEGPSITFAGTGLTLPVKPGQTICDVAEENNIWIKAECHAGICGSDPVRIVSGWENMESPPGDQEEETLEDLCELDPKQCRLACKARVKGPITVEILEV